MAIILSSDWETGSVQSGWQNYEYPTNNPSALSVSTDRAKTGTKSMKIFLASTDNEASGNNNRRAELTINNSTNPNTNYRWYGFSWYFPSASMLSDSKECVLIQWHDKAIAPLSCSTSPCLAIEAKSDNFRAMIRYNNSSPSYCSNNNPVLQIFPMGAIPKDQWVNIVIYFDPKVTTDGVAKVWVNGELKVDYVGRCMFNGSYFPYLKVGVYKWLWNGSVATPPNLTFYLDAFKIGDVNSSYNEVFPGGGAVNNPPIVSAGSNQVLPSISNSCTLTGTATDADGSIVSTTWTRVSGPNTPTIVSPNSLSTSVTGLIPGTYSFRLSATDNSSNTSTATVTIRVNLLPTINLSGNTTSYPAGTTSISLTSIVTDPDGVVVSYLWSKLSGPSATISTPTTANTNITGLTAGTYLFQLAANDNDGEVGNAPIEIVIGVSTVLTLLKIFN